VATVSRQSHTLISGFIHYFLQLLDSEMNWLPTANIQIQLLKSKLRSFGQSILVPSILLDPTTTFLLLSNSWGFVDVGRFLRREDASFVYNCCWPSPTQSFSGHSPAGLMTIFYCLRFKTPPTWKARFPYLHPQEQGGLLIPPGIGFLFLRLLRLAGSRWSYSNPPSRRDH
jgi:hypothetical protein